MRKIYYFVCGKYKKFKNLRISYILKNIIYSQKCQFFLFFAVTVAVKMKIYFKEILGLINNIKINQKRAEENIGQEFRLKKIDKT